MKRTIFAILLCASTTSALCQILATYSYERDVSVYSEKWYRADMCLMENGEFIFSGGWRYGSWNIRGNWHLRNDSILVLNSVPQKTRFRVREEYKTQKGLKRKYRKYFRNHAEISVLDDSLENWTPCYLFTISEKGDTVKHRWNGVGPFLVENNFDAFYIDRGTTKSPTYRRKSKSSNYFLILFPSGYIFENEEWIYKKDYLIPLDQNGKDYKMKRNEVTITRDFGVRQGAEFEIITQ